jgi:23S rRNA pseudouridine2604 synthase
MSEQQVRLSKRMVELGLCSRREADEFIEQGLVQVDGKVMQVLGCRVHPGQQITLSRPETAATDARVTLLLNQPLHGPQAASNLIRQENRSPEDHSGIVFSPRHLRQLVHCHQLDSGVSGFTVLTQDQRLAQKLAECEAEFLVAVEAAPSVEQLKQRKQTLVEAGFKPASITITRQGDRQLRFVLQAPRPGQIALMCQQLQVVASNVRCIRIGRMALGKIAPGQWRYLLPTERF